MQTQVADSRPLDTVDTVRRRRRCLDCKGCWTTYEIGTEDYTLVVKLLKFRNAMAEIATRIEAIVNPNSVDSDRLDQLDRLA